MTESNLEGDQIETPSNIVMEETEDASPACVPCSRCPGSTATLWMFVLAGLLFAGSHVWANRGEWRDALGMPPLEASGKSSQCHLASSSGTPATCDKDGQQCTVGENGECSSASCPASGCTVSGCTGSESKSTCETISSGLANSLLKNPNPNVPPAPAMPEEI